MPFDGVHLETDYAPHISSFPGLCAGGTQLWIRRHLHRWFRTSTLPLALAPTDHFCSVALLLINARALIDEREHWTQGCYRWFWGRRCAIGALCTAASGTLADIGVLQSAHGLLLTVADRRRFSTVESLNDHSTHGDVIRAFDEAIALAWAKALVSSAVPALNR